MKKIVSEPVAGDTKLLGNMTDDIRKGTCGPITVKRGLAQKTLSCR